MTLITDYGLLRSAIQDWAYRANDTNFGNNADAFVDLFERSFKRDARVLEMQKTTTDTLSASTLAIPSDYLELIRFQLTSLTPKRKLTYVTPDQAAELDATEQASGVAVNYTILSGNFVVTPQAWVGSGTGYELIYYAFTQLKDTQNGTNWLLQKHPDLYLFGSLVMGAAYIDDKDTVAFWQQRRDAALAGLLEADKKARVAGPLRMRPSINFAAQRFLRPGA